MAGDLQVSTVHEPEPEEARRQLHELVPKHPATRKAEQTKAGQATPGRGRGKAGRAGQRGQGSGEATGQIAW